MENHSPHERNQGSQPLHEDSGAEKTGLPPRLMSDMRAFHQYKNISSSQAYEMLHTKAKKRNRIQKIVFKLLPYAAMLAIGLAVVWYLQKGTPEIAPEPIAEQSLITPEWNNKAMLVLSDGSVLALDQDENTQLQEEGGMRIQNNAGGVLSYMEENGAIPSGLTNKLLIPAGARYQLKLSDGTEVWLNAATELEYPVRFGQAERRVKLKGEAFFHVRTDAARPFIVELDNGSVIATGTSFNISSYASDPFMETTLVSGKINIQSTNGLNRGMVPGEQFRLNRADQTYVVQQVDTRFFTSWKEGVLLFNSVSLSELAQKLERWYDVKISFASEKSAQLKFSGAMENSRKLEFLLGLISESSGISYEIRGNTIVIK